MASESNMAGAAWFDKATARVIITALLFVVAGAFMSAAWRVIVVFIFAIFLAYVLAPAVAWAQARKKFTKGSRAGAILAVYAAPGNRGITQRHPGRVGRSCFADHYQH